MNPIIYETDLQVRFSDLDPYGHVAAHNFIAYVIASRWQYAQDTIKVSADELIKKKVGFYTTKTEVFYVRPITGTPTVRVRSHVSESVNGNLTVPFSITSTTGEKEVIFSKGHLEVKVISLESMKPMDLPAWAEYLFFQPTSGT